MTFLPAAPDGATHYIADHTIADENGDCAVCVEWLMLSTKGWFRYNLTAWVPVIKISYCDGAIPLTPARQEAAMTKLVCKRCGDQILHENADGEDLCEACTDRNTRPAAPVEGLEYDRIINHVNSYGTTHEEDPRRIYTKCQLDLAIRLASKTSGTHTKLDELETVVVSYGNDLVSRSQAVAIIAAERAKAEEFADEIKEAAYEVWPEANDVGSDAPDIIRELGKERDACQTEAEDLKNKLYRAEAIIAALTARVKELDDECNELVKTSNEVVGQRDHAMNLCAQMEEEKEALETQLAAASETAAIAAYRACAETRHVTLGERAAAAVRAALEVKS